MRILEEADDSRKSRIEERRSSTPNGRRLIRVESSFFCADTSDEEFEDTVNSSTGANNKAPSSPIGGLGDYPHHSPLDPSSPLHSPLPHFPPEEDRTALKTGTTSPWQRTAYDLVTQLPPSVPRRAGGGAGRRHTLGVLGGAEAGSRDCTSAPVSRPDSRQTGSPESLSCTLPSEISWSRTSLQEDLLKSKQWEEECLSLTLEEIVHIRSVLTKAELESLPVECRVKEDAERRKVCFLCMKTRFGIFGPWGQICRLCKRTVCAKCYSKMRIPTEHFSHVPVVALSPSLLSPSTEEDTFPKCLAAQLGVGSAPVSPSLSRTTASGGNPSGRPNQQMSTSLICDGPISLPPSSPSFSPSDKWRVAKARALGRQKAEKLKGLQMTVCHDCKAMVLQIIKSSRATRDHAIRNLTLDLSPVY